ncbi:hypothetical protein ANTHOS_130 [Bacillus phage Anthos]|uniref:Uncharacterized protein n=1 Tax=Bacillus phage Anthos TaxID=2796502 RepID=A0A7U3T8Q0_9CAUD|nr:hypothetical protein ANTHOS_130 [Bacillus phage Anthos]
MEDKLLNDKVMGEVANIVKELNDHLESLRNMTPEEREDYNTKRYIEQYFAFFKDVYGENPKYDYTRDGDKINVKVYPYQPLEYITVEIKL